MLSDLFGVSYLYCACVTYSHILSITHIVINASSGVDSILCRLYFTYFEIAVQTLMSGVG